MESSQSYELAGISDRFIALVIDSIIIGIVGGIFGVGGNWWGGGLVGFLIGAIYQWYFLTQQNGQTLGKKVMNIRVIKVDGGPIRDSDAVLRFIGYYINSFIIGIGWIWALFDKENRGWHDLIANTYVVKANSANNVIIDEKRKNSF